MTITAHPFAALGTMVRPTPKILRGSSGGLVTVGPDLLPFAWDPITLQPRGVFVEGPATNLCIHARTPGGTGWTSLGIEAPAAIAGPADDPADGTLLTEAPGLGPHLIQIPGIAVTLGEPYTWSVFVAPGTASLVQLTSLAIGFGGLQTLNFNLTGNGVLGVPTAGVLAAGVERFGEWYRIWVTGVATSTSANAGWALTFITAMTNGRAPSFEGTGRTLRVAWPQIELGVGPSSPVLPPVGAPAAAVRAADLLSLPLTNPLWRFYRSGGTLVVEHEIPRAAAAGAPQTVVALADAADVSGLMIRNAAGGTAMEIASRIAGVDVAVVAVGQMTPGGVGRTALAYDVTALAGSHSGGAVQAIGAQHPAALLDGAMLIGRGPGGTGFLRGHVRDLVYVPLRLPDETLVALSNPASDMRAILTALG